MLATPTPEPAATGLPHESTATLRPSEYTAALIQAVRAEPALAYRASALEIGSGSGVVLAAIAELGAASLCGVDIETSATMAGASLLHGMGYGDRVEMIQGDMWFPVAGRRFDLIVANLPQFPMETLGYGGRLPSWSSGGADGRRLLDRFLVGVGNHLAPGGRALITHNAFIDTEKSRQIVAPYGLSLRVVMTVMVYLTREKLELMNGSIRDAEEGRSLHIYGPHAFGDMHIVEIRALSAD